VSQIVRANLVIGISGQTTLNGRSNGLSSPADRRNFHAMRQQFDVILIGGQTARTEPYQKTPIPLVVISRSASIPEPLKINPMLNWWQLSPELAIGKCQKEFGEKVLIEGGANLVLAALPWITELSLTRSAISEGENKLEVSKLIQNFELISEELTPDEKFQLYKRAN